ncbi:MAG TPA: hypothetical protein VFH63_06550 [candidate division Zixibacteria bacterium]|nr:hypothetical protein [candidate division Zixibacteria bacterium]
MGETAPRPRPAGRRGERPAPLVGIVDLTTLPQPPFGSYAAVARSGKELLAAELSRRLGAQGAGVLRLTPTADEAGFHWGRWFAAAAAQALSGAGVDAIGYAGAGSLALLDDAGLDELLSPVPGEVVANNRFSADAFVVAGDLDAALRALETADTDNVAVRRLEEAGFRSRDLRAMPWSRFDVDTPQDLALLRLAERLPATRALEPAVAGFLEMATLPGGRRLELPHLAEIGGVVRDRHAELVACGRLPAQTLAYLETETACRVRAFVEERGMRSARDGVPRSLMADWARHRGPRDLVNELASLGDAVILDSRVVMAALAGSSDAAAWPPEEDRFASDFGDAARVATPWLAELTAAAGEASVPVLMGGHALLSDGLRILVEAAWLGR